MCGRQKSNSGLMNGKSLETKREKKGLNLHHSIDQKLIDLNGLPVRTEDFTVGKMKPVTISRNINETSLIWFKFHEMFKYVGGDHLTL